MALAGVAQCVSVVVLLSHEVYFVLRSTLFLQYLIDFVFGTLEFRSGGARGQYPPVLRAGAATGSIGQFQPGTTGPPAPPLKPVVGLLRHFDWRLRPQEPFQRTATTGAIFFFFQEVVLRPRSWLCLEPSPQIDRNVYGSCLTFARCMCILVA